MGQAATLRAAGALVIAISLLAGLSGPGHADAHIQGFGIASGGVATVTPGLSDVPQQHEMRLDFTATGAAYAGLIASPNVFWDCQYDDGEDASGSLQHGFSLTSLEPDETRERGVGNAVGRCTGWTPEYPFPFELTCPMHLLAYARSDMVLQLAGMCLYSWGPWMGGGDFTLTLRLGNPSQDYTRFDIINAVLRLRA